VLPAQAGCKRSFLLDGLIGLALLSSRGIFQAYSYWHDELLFTIWSCQRRVMGGSFQDLDLSEPPSFHLVLLKADRHLFGVLGDLTRAVTVPAWLRS